MCGILGEINFSNSLIKKDKFLNASNIINHRGPDHKGYSSDTVNYQFVFNRLSILDLSINGSQPMVSSCGRYICLLNGEIYNHKILKSELENNFQWRGTSDTEVLLNAWSFWGAECIKKLDGMFAFSIWDKKLKKLYLARDRIGEKPLYYYTSKGFLLFASRPSPILKLVGNLDYDLNSIQLYLSSGYLPRNKSIYNNVNKLEPGKYLEFTENNCQIISYWNLNDYVPDYSSKKSLLNYVDECDFLLKDSIKNRLVSDKPLGFFLSGGIDSSLIVALASKTLSKDQMNVFSLGFSEKEFDESKDANLLTDFLGINIKKKTLNANDLLKFLPNFYEKFDEPFFDSSAFPLMALSEFSKDVVDVVVTGDGGDELFGGYNYYSIIDFISNNKNIYNFVKIFSKILPENIFFTNKSRLSYKLLKKDNLIEVFSFIRSIKKDFNEVLLPEFKLSNSLYNQFSKSNNSMDKSLNYTDRVMRLDILHTLNDDYLQKSDLATMAYSIESRSPFLSKDIVEWSLQIPSWFKTKNFKKKIILRELAKKYLPVQLIKKKKRGFEIPIKHWLRNELQLWAKDLIDDSQCYSNLPLDQKKANDIFNLHMSKKRDCHPYLWAILMLLQFNKNKISKN
jgi:asparagine synthase (glutamine-hydrolysing)